MWSPTHVLVTVHRARNLILKGKGGTNDAFVTIALGKSKFRTSVKYNSSDIVEWHEECELPIPKQGNTAQIVLTSFHRSSVGISDEFLGMVSIMLSDLDFYERPKNRWYKLENKPGKDNNKARGELEVKVAFSVVALDDAAKKEKHKASLGQLSHMAHSVGGSLLSLGSLEKRKSLKSLAKSIGHKVTKGKKKLHGKDTSEGIIDELEGKRPSSQTRGEADPGVISEGESDDDFALDDLSHKSSASSLNTNQAPGNPVVSSLENLAGGEFLRRNSTTPPTKPPRNPVPQEKSVDEWEEKLFGKHGKDNIITDTLKRRSWDSPKMPLTSQAEEEEVDTNDKGSNKKEESKTNSRTEETPKKEDEKEISKFARKFKNFRRDSKFTDLFSDSKSSGENQDTPSERIIIGGETKTVPPRPNSKLSPEIMQKYEGKTREDLIEIITNMQGRMESQDSRINDLEDYLDNLLVRVMETTPRILQNPYMTNLKAATWRSTLSLT